MLHELSKLHEPSRYRHSSDVKWGRRKGETFWIISSDRNIRITEQLSMVKLSSHLATIILNKEAKVFLFKQFS